MSIEHVGSTAAAGLAAKPVGASGPAPIAQTLRAAAGFDSVLQDCLHVDEGGLHALGQFPQAGGDEVLSILEVAVGQEPQAAQTVRGSGPLATSGSSGLQAPPKPVPAIVRGTPPPGGPGR